MYVNYRVEGPRAVVSDLGTLIHQAVIEQRADRREQATDEIILQPSSLTVAYQDVPRLSGISPLRWLKLVNSDEQIIEARYLLKGNAPDLAFAEETLSLAHNVNIKNKEEVNFATWKFEGGKTAYGDADTTVNATGLSKSIKQTLKGVLAKADDDFIEENCELMIGGNYGLPYIILTAPIREVLNIRTQYGGENSTKFAFRATKEKLDFFYRA